MDCIHWMPFSLDFGMGVGMIPHLAFSAAKTADPASTFPSFNQQSPSSSGDQL
jgi:hypothetical protein